jgi:hypothetical protein
MFSFYLSRNHGVILVENGHLTGIGSDLQSMLFAAFLLITEAFTEYLPSVRCYVGAEDPGWVSHGSCQPAIHPSPRLMGEN